MGDIVTLNLPLTSRSPYDKRRKVKNKENIKRKEKSDLDS